MAGKKIFTDHEYQTSAHLVTPKVHTVPNISSHAGVLGQLAASGNNLYFHDGSNWFALIESNYAGALTGRPSFDPASGNIPFTVGAGHNDRVDNLNADLLDGYDTSTSAAASKIPVYGSSGVLKVGTPVATGDATTKAYVDDLVQGLDIKASVAAASTASLTLSGTQTVDGVSLSAGNRVLVKDQSTASQNGIYIVASGSWALAEDSDSGSLSEGAYVFVEGGTVNNNTGWTYTDSTSYTWAKFSGAGQLNAGDGLVKSGDTLNANVAAPISIVSDQITIADGAITGSKLANNTVTSTQLADSIQLNHIGLGVAPDTTYRLKTTGKSRFYNTTDIALLAETTGTNTAVFNTTSAPPNYIVDFRLAGNSKVRIEPDGDLHAVEKIAVGSGSPTYDVHVQRLNARIAADNGTVETLLQADSTIGYVGTNTNHKLILKTNNTSRLEIESDGDVKVINKLGIGVTPSFHLHVAAGNKLLAGGYTLLERTPTAENNNTLYVQSTGTDNNQALAKFTYGASAGGANTGNVSFVVARSASYFNSSLGIGVTPLEKLHVDGNIRLPDTTDTTSGIIYKDTSRFIHNYQHPTGDTAVPTGLNTFVGISSGNLSMGSTATGVAQGSYNSGFGYEVLNSLTTGYSNTAIGYKAGNDITTGYDNTIVGMSAGAQLVGGSRNTFIGDDSGLLTTSGANNTALGTRALRYNTTGSNNTIVGTYSLDAHTSPAGHTTLGYSALTNLTTGSYNIAIGYAAGSQKVATGNLTNASYGIYLGYAVDGTEGASGEIVIGKDAKGAGTNTTTIGGSNTTNTHIPYGNFNIANLPTSTADNSLIVESSGLLKKRTANSGIWTTNLGANRLLVSNSSGVITSDSRLIHLGGRVSFTGAIDSSANLKVDLVSDAITTNQTSYEKCFYASGLNGYNISSGVTDSGYRIAVDASAFVSDSTFAGTLAKQKAVWARHGANVSASGSTITDSYGVFIDSLTNSNTTITNLWGLYQSSGAAKNYFAGSVGIGSGPDGTHKLIVNGKSKLQNDIVFSSANPRIDFYSTNSGIRFFSLSSNAEKLRLTDSGLKLVDISTSTTDTNVIVESSGLLKKRALNNVAFAGFGSGTVGKIPLWTNNTTTLGDSVITQNGTDRVTVSGGLVLSGDYTDTGNQLNLWCNSSGHGYAAVYDFAIKTGSNNARTTKWAISNSGIITSGPTNYKIKQTYSSSNSSALLYSDDTGNLELRGGQTDYAQLYLKSGGRIGIGTDDPNARLEIKSDGSSATGAEIRLQHANNNSTDVVSTLNFANNIGSVAMIQGGTTGANNTGYISFFTDNAGTSLEKARITGDGNCGIGTVDPDLKLDVQATGVQANLGVERTDGSWATLYGGSSFSGVAFDNATYFKIAPGATANRTDTSGSGLIVDASGNVKVSTLEIVNNNESTTQTNFTEALSSAGLIINTQYTDNAYTPGLFWKTSNSHVTKPKAGIYLKGTASGTNMYFGTSNNYSTGITNDALVINPNGRVGIGTESPEDKLDIVGVLRISANKTANTNKTNRIRGEHYDITEQPSTFMFMNNFSTTNELKIGGGSSVENAVTSIQFFTASNNATTTGTERLLIDSAGHATFSGTITSTNNANSAGDNIVVSTTNKDSSLYAISSKRSGTTVGGMRIDGRFRASDGSAASPAYAFTDDTNTGMFRAGADHLQLVSGGTGRLKVTADVSIIGATDLLVTGANRRLSFTSGSGTVRTTTAADLYLATNNTNRVQVTSGGAVKATRDGGSNLIQVARIHDGSLTGNGTATSFTITHNLETAKPIAVVIDHTSGAYVEAQIVVASDNAISVTFNNPPASGKVYRVPVTG